ncbi:alkylation response protein AidB-like acyl-CoA dehydrogenase [Herbaspirillum sp. Sphag1AN]|uniref:acyl-CoA dehydrogenase family protein n=1 Tax=unclassified Herbaspirillum TaxID=2624150 RepID=UPI001616C7A3|nr:MULTISPECIES: acyl-CoA dehydrogenase family protein [unclassified Herbaspirillum]MBB3212938.1 alkylation response protein AidB-like acyl-CoA dehydrogenase [Herbaspirillum sp. Sphag1AN]MBB3246135.1 alkylation response protein AidB-like acyl-CoA dehydrogenase [Herbaspirillum sp. Sphag64]
MAIIWEPTLDPQASAWRSIARQVAQDHVAPKAAEIDRNQRYPRETVELLYDCGIATMFLPQEYGGSGASLMAFCAVVEELAQACASTSGIVATLQLGAWPLLRAGSETQKETYIGAMARERKTISFALSEQEAGSDPSSMQTLALPENGGWRLRGTKRWIGGSGECAYYLVFAQTALGQGRRGIAAYIVDADAEGVSNAAPEDKMGMRGTVNSSVHFDTWVAAEAMIAGPGRALKLALEALNVGRVVVAAQANGIALAAFSAAAQRATARTAFGQVLIDHQGIGFQLADVATRLSAGRMLAYETARNFDTGKDVALIGAQAKLFCSEAAHDAVDIGVQVFGAEGFVKPSLVERLYRDQRATEIYEGTSEIQRLVLARAIHAEFNEEGA